MVDVNWSLLNGGTNALQSFGQGMKIGQDIRERREAAELKKAVTGYAMSPTDPNALAPVIAADPRLGLQLRGQQQQQVRQAQEQRRADLPMITRLVETSTDEASFQRNRAMAQELGIDVSTLPAQFDPAWREQQLVTLKALQDPTKAEALSTAGKIAMDMGLRPGTPEFNAKVTEIWQIENTKTIPYTQGGGVATMRPGGAITTLIQPNDGTQPTGAPVGGGGGLREGVTATNPKTGEKVQFRGGQWVPLGQGGGGARVTSNFLDGL